MLWHDALLRKNRQKEKTTMAQHDGWYCRFSFANVYKIMVRLISPAATVWKPLERLFWWDDIMTNFLKIVQKSTDMHEYELNVCVRSVSRWDQPWKQHQHLSFVPLKWYLINNCRRNKAPFLGTSGLVELSVREKVHSVVCDWVWIWQCSVHFCGSIIKLGSERSWIQKLQNSCEIMRPFL